MPVPSLTRPVKGIYRRLRALLDLLTYWSPLYMICNMDPLDYKVFPFTQVSVLVYINNKNGTFEQNRKHNVKNPGCIDQKIDIFAWAFISLSFRLRATPQPTKLYFHIPSTPIR